MTTTRQSSASKSAAKSPVKSAARTTGEARKATKRPATRPTAPVKPGTPVKPVQTKTSPTIESPKVNKKAKTDKVKVVRDSFTIPKAEYACIAEMKKRALGLGAEVKKSELIRAGLALLVALPDSAFSKALAQVPTLKTGRPGKV
jgi:hypothetical protein